MLEHAKYDEFCALAAAGQISAEQLADLESHLQECSLCENTHNAFLDINSIWLSQAQELEPEMYGKQPVLRNKILGTLQDAGANFSDAVRHEMAAPSKKLRFFPAFKIPAPLWAAAAVALIAGFLGFQFGSHKHIPPGENGSASVRSVGATLPPSADAGLASKTQTDLPKDLEQRVAAAELERTKALAEVQSLRQSITDLQSSKNDDANQIAQLKARTEEQQTAVLSAEAQVHALKKSQDSKVADLVATQTQLRDLEGKLADQRTAAEREKALTEVSSSSEMRDVIASRNLHIIDVSDVANSGVQKPFGRIFYTEGKSLIFYAYDLAGAKGSKTFYAWGHREGDTNTTRVLGSLQLDDPAQGRWVFKSNDAKVLAQIDSVYVTLEPTSKAGERPQGKRILSAFLGTQANHP
jgi:hypothetical protein